MSALRLCVMRGPALRVLRRSHPTNSSVCFFGSSPTLLDKISPKKEVRRLLEKLDQKQRLEILEDLISSTSSVCHWFSHCSIHVEQGNSARTEFDKADVNRDGSLSRQFERPSSLSQSHEGREFSRYVKEREENDREDDRKPSGRQVRRVPRWLLLAPSALLMLLLIMMGLE
jgi:hypothetical protein